MNWKNILATILIASGVSFLLNPVSLQAVDELIRSNVMQLGRSDATDKEIIFNKGAGSSNPRLIWDESDSVLKGSHDGAAFFVLGAGGGGGGGGLNWHIDQPGGPLVAVEFDEEVFYFNEDANQSIHVWIRVPDSFFETNQIKLFISAASSGTSGDFSFRMTSTLIEKDTDPIDDTTDTKTQTVSKTSTVARQYRELQFDVTDSSGEINSTPVQAGDLIKIKIDRPTGDTDTGLLRFVPSGTEVTFS